ncbi:MAG: exodeoxyribonuclease V subunit alpha, partial [Comamonas sp.]
AACALMATTAFGILTGGPGTGKTTTVVRLLALLQSLALRQGGADEGAGNAGPSGQGEVALRIRLAAPTGKAAARLQESVSGAVRGLDLSALPGGEAIRAQVPSEVTTLHRLLGSLPDSRRFRHHAGHPLALDVLVIDEASMIDLEMMAAVLAALPAHARLLILGDKDQLSSVEAGAVLGSLCARSGGGHFWPRTAGWLAEAGGGRVPPELCDTQGRALDQSVVMLRQSRRFDADSGIGRLAQAVNLGQPARARQLLDQPTPGLAACRLRPGDDQALRRLAVEGGESVESGEGGRVGYRHYLALLRRTRPPADAPPEAFDAWARGVLAAHGRFQVLCALRAGPWGVEGLNLRIARLLQQDGWLDGATGWFLGRPVLVTRNDYGLGLMNGDIGITLALPHSQMGTQMGTQEGSGSSSGSGWRLRVAFASAGGAEAGVRWILPSRLQDVQTVFAMTVHKSQGSEFDHAALLLPERMSPVLTRELVYTGITRARRWFTLATPEAGGGAARGVLEAAIGRRVQRSGGLDLGWGR